MSEPFNIGVVGLGDRVGSLIERLLQNEPQVRLWAVCDPAEASRDRARRLAPQVQLFDDLSAFLADPTMRWVFIGSPNYLHREHATAALRAGKHVFCEKPLATNLEDCLAIRDVVQESPGSFFFGLTLRYAPLYRKIRELLSDGVIGQIISVESNENLNFNHGGFIHQDWRRKRSLAGTHLLEKCCHDIDVLHWMIGDRARYVASFGGNRYFVPENQGLQDEIGPSPDGRPAYQSWPTSPRNPFTSDKDIFDHQVAIVEFERGVRAMFHTNCAAGIPERRLLLLGTTGAIRADLNTGRVELRRIGWDEPTAVYKVADDNHGGADPILVQAMGDWVVREAEPITGIDHAIESAVVCFAMDEAADERSVVDLMPWWGKVADTKERAKALSTL